MQNSRKFSYFDSVNFVKSKTNEIFQYNTPQFTTYVKKKKSSHHFRINVYFESCSNLFLFVCLF